VPTRMNTQDRGGFRIMREPPLSMPEGLQAMNRPHGSEDVTGALVEAEGQLDGELGAGRSLRGELGYDVSSDGPWELILEPSLFGFGQAIYTIDLADVE
jgi:hypothetical protein